MEATSQVARLEFVLVKQKMLAILAWCPPMVQDLRVVAQVWVLYNIIIVVLQYALLFQFKVVCISLSVLKMVKIHWGYSSWGHYHRCRKCHSLPISSPAFNTEVYISVLFVL